MVKHWMKKAFANSHGQERNVAHRAGMSTHAYAEKHQHDKGRAGKRARLALVGMRARKK
jgi:hypothetical protein